MSEQAPVPTFNAMKHARCECYRQDPSDPLGQIPSSIKLQQLEVIFLVYQFIAWSDSKGEKQVEFVKTKLCEQLECTREEFEEYKASALRMYRAFGAASDAYLKEMPESRLIVRH